MLIYLDANIVQYCADYGDFVFDREGAAQPPNRNLKMELRALGEVIELAVRAEVQDLDHRWDVAAPIHLLEELSRGNLSQEQLDTYRSLREAWQPKHPRHGYAARDGHRWADQEFRGRQERREMRGDAAPANQMGAR